MKRTFKRKLFAAMSLMMITILSGMFNVLAAQSIEMNNSIIDMEKMTAESSKLAEQREELEEEGWILVDTEYIDLSGIQIAAPSYSVMSTTATVTGYYATVDTYKKPIQQKSYTNSTILDVITNFSAPVSTVIAAGLPKYKWIPSAVGFVSRTIANLSAQQLSTFQAAETLYVESIMVDTDMTPGYTPYARAERKYIAASSVHTGYRADSTPFSNSTDKSLDVKSLYYDDLSFLTTMALDRAVQYAHTPFVDPCVLPSEF